MLRATLLAALALAACSSRVVGPDHGPVDGAIADTPTVDSVPPLDGSAPFDGATPPDVVIPFDHTPSRDDGIPFDGTTPADAPATSLQGMWRVLRYEFQSKGNSYTLTDRDTLIDTGEGTSAPFRVNGLLYLTPTHFALTFGTLASGYFYSFPPTKEGDDGYSAMGYGMPGVLDDARGEFTVTTAPTPTRFTRNADGTIAFVDATSGVRTTFARTSTPGPPLTSINTVGLAVLAEDFTLTARRPRVALLWDLQGEGNWLENNGSALRFTTRFATFPVVLTAAPMAARTPWMGSEIAIARIVVYDDSNGNLAYDRATDSLLGLSPVAITWRAATDFAPSGPGHFPLRYVPDGLRYGHVHPDFALGGEDVVPFDHVVPVTPGVALNARAPGAIPEIL